MYDNLTRTNLEFAHREVEKRIAELEKEYTSLKGLRKYELNVAKLEKENLEKENAELKARLNAINQLTPELEKCLKLKKQQFTQAKELIKNIIRVTWGEGWNYSLDWKVKAEQFLKTEVLAVWNLKRTQNDPDKLTDDVMNDWKEMED